MNETHDVIAHFRHYAITQAQVDACTRVVDPDTRIVHYEVKSATTAGVVYRVHFDRRFGKLACQCMAFNFPTCWHRRAVTVAERIFKEALRKQYEASRKEIESSAEYRMEVSQISASQADRNYKQALKELVAQNDEAAKRELRALRKHGAKAYESEGFKFLK